MNPRLAVFALATAALAACESNPSVRAPAAALQAARVADVSAALSDPGAVYTLTNQVGGNAVAVFARGADGRLTTAGTVSTGGTGTGASLGSQSAVTLSDDGRWLFAVNAGSNDVSVFSVKNTNQLDVYAVDANGVATGPTTTASAGGTPFGFSFGHRNELFVSEAAGSASSYELDATSGVSLVSGAVLTHQGAPCWAVVTNDGRIGFTGNGAGSVSAFAIAPDGAIGLVDANGGTALIGAGINDIALSHNGRYLYVLQTGGAQAIHAFRVEADGHLTALGPIAGLPNGTRGLTAF